MVISHAAELFGYLNRHMPTTDLVNTSNVKKAGRWAFKISEPSIQQPTASNGPFPPRGDPLPGNSPWGYNQEHENESLSLLGI
jgi:hypothetical protein